MIVNVGQTIWKKDSGTRVTISVTVSVKCLLDFSPIPIPWCSPPEVERLQIVFPRILCLRAYG